MNILVLSTISAHHTYFINKIDKLKSKNELLPFIEFLRLETGLDKIIPISALKSNLDKVSEDESHHASSQQRKKTYKFKTKDGSHDVKITFEVTDNNKKKTDKKL